MARKLVVLSVILAFLAPVLAKGTEQETGEEELFVKDEAERDSEFRKGFEVTLGLELDWLEGYGYSKELFSMQNKAYEARFPLTVAYVLSENSKMYVLVPYVLKYAFVGYHYLSLSEEWEFAMGLGDIRGGISYQIMTERSRPVNMQVSADVISNTGRVHYGPLNDRRFGNGYWNIAPGVGISKSVHTRSALFGSANYVYRFKKEKYKPDDIGFYALGIVSLVGKKSWVGLEFQRTSRINAKRGWRAEARFGITLKEVKNGVLTETVFVGKGWLDHSEENSEYWLLTLTVPLRLKIFGVSF